MDRPNILFILFDSAPARWVGIGSTPDVATPNIDRIAAEGVSFTQAYCAAGVCHPARASLDSGLFPHANGQLNNTPGAHSYMFRMRADLPLMPELLRDAGYRCGTATQPDQPRGYADTVPMRRWMDLLEERRSGWDSDGAAERDPDVPHCGRYKLGPEATRDGVYASGAVELIEHYAGLRGPWFLKVDFDGPHLPQHLPDPYHERVSDRTPLPENFHDPLDGKPAVQHHLR